MIPIEPIIEATRYMTERYAIPEMIKEVTHMNKEELLKKYISDMNKEQDRLRTVFPNANYSDGKHMDNGFTYCRQVSLNWIEQMLESLASPTMNEPQRYFTQMSPEKSAVTAQEAITKKEKMKKLGGVLGSVGKDVLGMFGNTGVPPGLSKDKKDLLKI